MLAAVAVILEKEGETNNGIKQQWEKNLILKQILLPANDDNFKDAILQNWIPTAFAIFWLEFGNCVFTESWNSFHLAV